MSDNTSIINQNAYAVNTDSANFKAAHAELEGRRALNEKYKNASIQATGSLNTTGLVDRQSGVDRRPQQAQRGQPMEKASYEVRQAQEMNGLEMQERDDRNPKMNTRDRNRRLVHLNQMMVAGRPSGTGFLGP
jgi:hypothetical protein